MRRFLFYIVLCVFAVFHSSAANGFSTEGTEFYLGMMGFAPEIPIYQDQDDEGNLIPVPLSRNLQLWVLVAARQACTGEITNPRTGYRQSFSVDAGQTVRLNVPAEQVYSGSWGDTVMIADRGLRVTTSDTVSVYLGNYADYSFDASIVLPVPSLGRDYRIVSYASPDEACALVVAVEDGTEVEVTFANDVYFDDVLTYLKGTTHSFRLDRGQTLLLAGVGLLGSRVRSASCRPIAVFSGNYCPFVPNDCPACDVLVEQLPPTSAWGRHFLVNPTLERERDSRLLIKGDEPETHVTMTTNGRSERYTMGEEQYIELELSNSDVRIESDKPIAVTQYAIGGFCNGFGDPFMLWISPTEQRVRTTVFSPCPSPQITEHYVQVITPTATVSQTFLDGQRVGHLFSPFSQDADYSYARIRVEPSAHTLSNLSGGLTAYVYGYGHADESQEESSYESYGYFAGASVKSLADVFEQQDSQQAFDRGETVHLRRYVHSSRRDILWLLNGEPIAEIIEQPQRDTLDLSFSADLLLMGENTVAMVLLRECGNDTVWSPIYRKVRTQTDAAICEGDTYDFYGLSVKVPGDYEKLLRSTTSPVDTVAMLHLTVLQRKFSTQMVSIDYGESFSYNGHVYDHKGVYLDTLRSADGCDSIMTTHVSRTYSKCPEVNIPSFFTPNGDGANDRWVIENLACYEMAVVRVFDRYGKKLAEYSAASDGWDGNYNGDPCPTTDYWFELELPEIQDKRVGHFLLKR